jgi:NAD+ synthase (glutamine-hydrolysing)
MFLANDGNYREMRWFSPWTRAFQVEDHDLSSELSRICGQTTVSFGDGIIKTDGVSFGTELCEVFPLLMSILLND